MPRQYHSYTNQKLLAALTAVNDDLGLASYHPGDTPCKEVCFD